MRLYDILIKGALVPIALASIYSGVYASETTQPATQPSTRPVPSLSQEEFRNTRPEIRNARITQRQMLANRLAGFYAGTVKLTKTDEGYSWSGSYNPSDNPEAMEKMLYDADKDQDGQVTSQELRTLNNKIIENQNN